MLLGAARRQVRLVFQTGRAVEACAELATSFQRARKSPSGPAMKLGLLVGYAAVARAAARPLPVPGANGSVAVLSPIRGPSRRRAARFLGLLLGLALPPDAESCVALLCDAGAAELLGRGDAARALRRKYSEVLILADKEAEEEEAPSEGVRHEAAAQRLRRRRLAAARNRLIRDARVLRFDWTLWLDSDLLAVGAGVLRELAEAREDGSPGALPPPLSHPAISLYLN